METRRGIICGLMAAGAMAPALADPHFQKATGDTPKATLVPGSPAFLDFSDGVKVPCSKQAFLTLWEGPGYWLTFGAGRSVWQVKATGEARTFAISCMKALLLTLAFQPDRMVLGDGHGWRLKDQDVKNYVRGDIDLPGQPFYPISDAEFGGGAGNTDASGSWEQSTRQLDTTQAQGMPVDTMQFRISSFMAYVVLKKDLSLDDVKKRAALIVERPRS